MGRQARSRSQTSRIGRSERAVYSFLCLLAVIAIAVFPGWVIGQL
jgi:hypothetical protein